MRAVRYYGKEDIRLDEVPEPQWKDYEVIVAPAYNGICGTDMHEYIFGPHEHPAQPHPLTREQNPIILGHEFSGVIASTGSKVTSLRIGDKVAVKGTLSCGKCEPCKLAADHVCIVRGNLGQSGVGGGLAEKCPVDSDMCFKLPTSVELDVGALCEPFAVSEHGISLIQPPPRSDRIILILGAGAIGLAAVQLLRARGLNRVIVSDPSETRRNAARSFGALHTLDSCAETLEQDIKECTGGGGPHIVIDCAGVPVSARTAVTVVRNLGTVIQIAIHGRDVTFEVDQLAYKEVIYRGSLSHTPKDWINVIEYMEQGKIQPRDMITKIIPIEKIVEEGILGLQRADEGLLKILVQVNSEERIREVLNRAR